MTSVGRSQGRDIVLDSRSEHVRVWVLDDLLHDSERPQQSVVRYGQLAMIPDVAICGSAESLSINDVVFFDPLQGKVRQRLPVPTIGVADGVKAIASGGASQLFAANRNGTIFKLKWEGQSKLSTLFTAHQRLEQLRVTHWRGKTLGFTTGCDETRRYSVRIWDLETGEELFTNRSFALQYGEQDKALLALAVSEIEDDVRFAFAGQYGKIMVANLVAKPAGLYPADFDVWQLPFPTAGTTYTRCLAVWGPLLAAGTEKGELAILDFSSGECLATKRNAHRGEINSLATRWVGGKVVLLSGGSDGSVAFWSSELEPLQRIEIGEAVYSAIWISDKAIAAGTARGLVSIQLSEL